MGGLLIGDPSNRLTAPWTAGDAVKASVPPAVLSILAAGSYFFPIKTPPPSIWSSVAGVLVNAALFLLPVYWFAMRKRGASFSDLGFRHARFPYANLVFSVVVIDLATRGLLLALIRPHSTSSFTFGSGWRGFALSTVFGIVATAFIEETFFRGFFFVGLRTRLAYWPAASISAVFFGLGHNWPFTQIFTGFLFAWLRERTGSLWPCIVTHACINAVYFALSFAIRHRV